jgi:hypothetical protein
MSFRFGNATRVLSILDLKYEPQIQNFYFPALAAGAKKRLTRAIPQYEDAIKHALTLPSSRSVWAIIIEKDNKPLLVAQNLMCTVRNGDYRRVLRIQVDHISPDTSHLIHNSRWREVSDP